LFLAAVVVAAGLMQLPWVNDGSWGSAAPAKGGLMLLFGGAIILYIGLMTECRYLELRIERLEEALRQRDQSAAPPPDPRTEQTGIRTGEGL
jgi:hypothetical protein